MNNFSPATAGGSADKSPASQRCIIRRLQTIDGPGHLRMFGAAILIAEKVVFAELRRERTIRCVYIPGRTSCLMRKAGIEKS